MRTFNNRFVCYGMLLIIMQSTLFCGCFSALHQGQVQDGDSMALALRPLDRKFVSQYDGFSITELKAADIRASMAFRHGWAPSKKGEIGASIGILVDFNDKPFSDLPPDITRFYGLPSLLTRGSVYLQFPKNSLFDAGYGVEFGIWPPVFPLIPYVVVSRNFLTRFTLYGEVRRIPFHDELRSSAGGQRNPIHFVPTFGVKFNLFKHFSLFVEMNRWTPKLIGCERKCSPYAGPIAIEHDCYGEYERYETYYECKYKSFSESPPAMAVGVVFH